MIFPKSAVRRDGTDQRSTAIEIINMKTILLAAAIGALAISAAFAKDTVQKISLKARLAINIAERAGAACAVDGYSVSAAVTDRSGLLLALVRSEQAGAHTADASRQKVIHLGVVACLHECDSREHCWQPARGGPRGVASP